MAIKRTKWDVVFSDFIRYRDKWTCQKCGKKYAEKSAGLHCSHFYGRRSWSTRIEPCNALAICYACHIYLGANPYEHIKLWESKFTSEEQDMVHCLHNQVVRKKDIADDYNYQKLKQKLEEAKNDF